MIVHLDNTGPDTIEVEDHPLVGCPFMQRPVRSSKRSRSFIMRERQRGMVLPLLAVGLLAIVGIVGLSIDVGHAFLNKTRLQNSLDSAALSGARTLLLTDDVGAASADARDAFGEHLGGEMAGLAAEDLVLQYSDTLIPFVAGGGTPRYVRAAIESFPTDVFFAGVLQGVGRSTSIAGTAVAGPLPLGYPGAEETCDIAPLLMCGVAGDSDCTDGACFDFEVGTGKDYGMTLKAGVDNEPLGATEFALQGLAPATCGEGDDDADCGSAPESGEFLLHELDCNGASCVRERLAGSFDVCLTGGEQVDVQNVGAPKQLFEGLMARFGIDDMSLPPSDYPPDVVTTEYDPDVGPPHDSQYDGYRSAVASLIAAGSTGGGVAYRRVLTVPVVSCSDGALGGSANTVLGFLCLFLMKIELDESELGGEIYGEFVDRCESSGEQGASVPAMSDAYDGPMEIVLYKDPDSIDS